MAVNGMIVCGVSDWNVAVNGITLCEVADWNVAVRFSNLTVLVFFHHLETCYPV